MATGDKTRPQLSQRGQDEQAARQAREARALRENLRKRASQRRGRGDRETAPEATAPGAGGGPADPGDA